MPLKTTPFPSPTPRSSPLAVETVGRWSTLFLLGWAMAGDDKRARTIQKSRAVIRVLKFLGRREPSIVNIFSGSN
jgi:hypothetical protein